RRRDEPAQGLRRAGSKDGSRIGRRGRGAPTIRQARAPCHAADQRRVKLRRVASQRIRGLYVWGSCAAAAYWAENARVGKRNKIPRRSQKYAFSTKSWYVAIPANVMGTSRSPAYQKITNASGNQGEPLSFLTTRQAESRMAKVMTNQSMSPPIPISTTSVPKPLSTPMIGGFA